MTFIEAFASIFVNLAQFFTMPAMMTVYACIVMTAGIIAAILAFASLGTDDPWWSKLVWFVSAPLVIIIALAIMIWAGTSSPDGITWS